MIAALALAAAAAAAEVAGLHELEEAVAAAEVTGGRHPEREVCQYVAAVIC